MGWLICKERRICGPQWLPRVWPNYVNQTTWVPTICSTKLLVRTRAQSERALPLDILLLGLHCCHDCCKKQPCDSGICGCRTFSYPLVSMSTELTFHLLKSCFLAQRCKPVKTVLYRSCLFLVRFLHSINTVRDLICYLTCVTICTISICLSLAFNS